jgi:maleylacetate reductase
MRFAHETLGQRVRFAPGEAAAAVGDELDRLGARRVMAIGRGAELVPGALVYKEVVMHVPVAVAERARAAAAEHGADALVSVGGGSATGLAKAVALTTGLPIVAVPTTFAGSEATDVWGLTEGARKTTGTDPRVLPRAVIYDETLTRSLPAELAIASGLNALAHCVDSMWAPRADPINAALAAEGIRALAAALPSTGSGTQYGAYLAAVAFASAGSGLHHKICHVLGGMFDLPHAPTHAVVLPYVLALNAPAAPRAADRIARAFGSETALDGLLALRQRLGAPRALRDYGLAEEQIPAAAAAILPVVPADNPVKVTAGDLERLLHDAWEGADPR